MNIKAVGSVFKKIAETVLPIAPVVAAGLGGPATLAVPALRILAEKLGLDLEAPNLEEQVLKKVETVTAADLLAIKKAEQEYQVQMEQIGLDREKIHQLDRESARKRQVDTGDKFPNYLAITTLGIFGFCIFYLLYLLTHEVKFNTEIMALINVVVGGLIVSVKQIYDYFFGSSAGSKRKTEIMGGKG